jgi:hypothetical protein
MNKSYITSPYLIEPQIRMPTFFKSKSASKRPDSELQHRINKLEQHDRYLKLLKHNNDAWLRKRGKGYYTGFTPAQRKQNKAFFDALDTEGSGGVTIEELFEPLLALGLVETKDDVRRLFHREPQDRSPVIDFEEFESILESEKVSGSSINKMISVFMRPSMLPYKVRISSQRRKIMLQAYMARTPKKRECGQAVIKIFAEEINSARPVLEKAEVLMQKKLKRLSSLHKESPNTSAIRAPSAGTSRRRSPDKKNSLYRHEESKANLSGLL